MAAVRLLLFPFLFLTLSLSRPSLSLSENEALLKLKQSFNNPASLSSWVPDSSPCSAKWVGVICVNDVVSGLRLPGLGLSGNIDIDALTELRGLRTISFENNSFSGPFPDFHKLGALKALFLSSNQFSGPIPGDLFTHLDSLKKCWLNANQFSGNIPGSLTEPKLLAELHLENNEFSGRIPDFKQDFKSLDFSNNKLEGQIPYSLAKYGPKTFSGNEGLCGEPLENPCLLSASESNWVIRLLLVLSIFVSLAALFLVTKKARRNRDDDYSVASRENVEEAVQVHMPSPSHSQASSSSRKGGDSRKAAASRNAVGDIVMVNDERGVFGMPDMMKAAAEVLGTGGMGSAYKAAMTNGLSVVVKRMREMNRLTRDVFDAEMRRYGRFRHPNVLPPLAYHYRKEEKLVVSEYMPKGSLLYVLHGDRGTSHAGLNWPTRLKIIQGIARGLGFLYSEFPSEDLPHGNLKSSNILLGEKYNPVLSDYGFNQLVNPNMAVQSMFAYKSPDYIQNQQVSPKTDVYCFGIVILEIITGKFPSQYHSNGKGGTDVVQWVFTAISERRDEELIDPAISSEKNSLSQMLQLLQIGAACTESNPEQRLTIKEAIRRIEEI